MAVMPERLLDAVAFVERNLTQDISPEDIASQAAMSLRTLQRQFKTLTGDGVADYLRGRRLSEASRVLINSPARILDVALDYQFNSQAVFTRAFQRQFWQSPGEFRQVNSAYAPQQKLALCERWLESALCGQLSSPQIKHWPAHSLVGLISQTAHHGLPLPGEQITPDHLWEALQDFPGVNQAHKTLLYQARFRVPPVAHHDPSLTDAHTVFTFSGVCLQAQVAAPPEFHQYNVPAGEYALFHHRGNHGLIRHTISYAFATWLPNSGYLFNAAAPVVTLHPLSDMLAFTLVLPVTRSHTSQGLW